MLQILQQAVADVDHRRSKTTGKSNARRYARRWFPEATNGGTAHRRISLQVLQAESRFAESPRYVQRVARSPTTAHNRSAGHLADESDRNEQIAGAG
jgi:hypothetical protein